MRRNPVTTNALWKLCAIALGAIASLSAPALAQEKRPNIVMLMTDDTGWNDFGALGYPFNRSCAYAVAMERPRVSTHYPESLGEFQAWFPTDADCLDYLEWLRWPCGFVCPSCGHPGGWRLGDGRFMCTGCGNRTSVMAGTIFDRTRTPLTVWFSVCWHFAAGKDGVSALSLKRTLEIGSYQTVWAILHR